MESHVPAPSLKQLAKSFAIASVIAIILLITAVLPAEYGIDPTGVGETLGLTQLTGTSAPENSANVLPDTTATAGATVTTQPGAYKAVAKVITLDAFEGIEFKALMEKGQQFMFSWTSNGANLYMDMHGEEPNAGDAFTTYWKEKEINQGQGNFIAPFSGSHGWYWQNMTEEPININVHISGFFDKAYIP